MGVRFEDGLRAPGRLLCAFLGNSVLRVPISIYLRRISDIKGAAPLGVGLGRWETGRLNQEAGECLGVKGGGNHLRRIKPIAMITRLVGGRGGNGGKVCGSHTPRPAQSLELLPDSRIRNSLALAKPL